MPGDDQDWFPRRDDRETASQEKCGKGLELIDQVPPLLIFLTSLYLKFSIHDKIHCRHGIWRRTAGL